MSVLLKPFARWYQKEVTKQLSKYGLKYEDMLVESADTPCTYVYDGGRPCIQG